MDTAIVTRHKEELLKSAPEVADYVAGFHSINKRWDAAITSAMIETGHMHDEESRLFGPLVHEMSSTRTKYIEIQQQLVDTILFEMVKKAVREIGDAAKFVINILKRNLYERTADVGYLATDGEIVRFLKWLRGESDPEAVRSRADAVRARLADYRHEYTVYNEIVVLDVEGRVWVNLDRDNRLSRSIDPLLETTQAIDLHGTSADKYVETFRPSDLRPGRGNVLIYSRKIEDPDNGTALGTLCLVFDFEDEMRRIFEDLRQANEKMILALLDAGGRVLCSSDPEIAPVSSTISVDYDADFTIGTLGGRSYLLSASATDGYQGFFGLTWYGLAMVDTEAAFRRDKGASLFDKSVVDKLRDFSEELSTIRGRSEDLLEDMKIDSINGQINAAKSNATAFVEILRFVGHVADEIDGFFNEAIENMQQTVAATLFNEVQFRAFQGNNIGDRNLYERANDVCWWALTPQFRVLLKKHREGGLTDEERVALTSNLQYINDLYTPYLRLVLADTEGRVVACSNPPDSLEERLVTPDLPTGQAFVGTRLDPALVEKALHLPSSKDYCVSDFRPTPLYGGRPTYVFSTAVRDPENDGRVVGVIQIVFDGEPQFEAMLSDTLPKDENRQVAAGCFGIFAHRDKTIISSTNPAYAAGTVLPLDDPLFRHEKGARTSTVVELGSRSYALGLQVSHGYREFKQNDGYPYDMICMIFVPM